MPNPTPAEDCPTVAVCDTREQAIERCDQWNDERGREDSAAPFLEFTEIDQSEADDIDPDDILDDWPNE